MHIKIIIKKLKQINLKIIFKILKKYWTNYTLKSCQSLLEKLFRKSWESSG